MAFDGDACETPIPLSKPVGRLAVHPASSRLSCGGGGLEAAGARASESLMNGQEDPGAIGEARLANRGWPPRSTSTRRRRRSPGRRGSDRRDAAARERRRGRSLTFSAASDLPLSLRRHLDRAVRRPLRALARGYSGCAVPRLCVGSGAICTAVASALHPASPGPPLHRHYGSSPTGFRACTARFPATVRRQGTTSRVGDRHVGPARNPDARARRPPEPIYPRLWSDGR